MKKNDLPLISIIVPVYKSEEFLDRCVESIVNQTYKNLEIILVDDGSPDSSPKKCDSWAEKDSRIKVVHKENGGASSARNAGLDAANGDFIGFVDDDDYIEPIMYAEMMKNIVKNDADAARCGIDRVYPSGKVEEWGTGNSGVVVADNKQLLKDVGEAAGIVPVHVGNKLFRKDCIKNVRFNSAFRFGEDKLFNFEVAENVSKMVYQDINYYHYFFNSDSVTVKELSESNFDELKVMDIMIERADDDVKPYCIKGSVYKSFILLRRISCGKSCRDRFGEIRSRIIKNKKAIFKSGIYSNATKLKTLLLLLSPNIYKLVVRIYSKRKYS
ncbi:MAG: glycosyltransferase [Eubacterium sp.]|nr:glycosyltransferase [Eubacterium sp.]